MEGTDRKLRRVMLRPLVRSSEMAVKKKSLTRALERLDHQALSESALPEIRDAFLEVRKQNPQNIMGEKNIAASVNLFKAVYQAGRMSTQSMCSTVHIISNVFMNQGCLTRSMRK